MSILSLFKSKHPQNNHTFSDDDREVSAEKRRMAALLKTQNDILAEKLRHIQQLQRQQQMQEQIEALEEQLSPIFDETEEEEEEDIGKSLLLNLLQNIQNKQPPQQMPQHQPLTEEQIKAIIATIPEKYLKIAKNTDDNSISYLIKTKYPAATEQEIATAIKIIRAAN